MAGDGGFKVGRRKDKRAKGGRNERDLRAERMSVQAIKPQATRAMVRGCEGILDSQKGKILH